MLHSLLPERLVEPIEDALIEQKRCPCVTVLFGSIVGGEEQVGLRAAQSIIQLFGLPGEKVIAFGVADQRRAGDLLRHTRQSVLSHLLHAIER